MEMCSLCHTLFHFLHHHCSGPKKIAMKNTKLATKSRVIAPKVCDVKRLWHNSLTSIKKLEEEKNDFPFQLHFPSSLKWQEVNFQRKKKSLNDNMQNRNGQNIFFFFRISGMESKLCILQSIQTNFFSGAFPCFPFGKL